METVLYYFSGTGNSLAIAKALCAELEDCSLVPIARSMEKKEFTAKARKIGFVFPLYYYGLPLLVEEFIKNLDLSMSEYIFFVETRGGTWSPEYVSRKLEVLLREKGKSLSAGFKLVMPNNYIKRGYKLNSTEVEKEKLERAKAKILEIAEAIRSNRQFVDKDTFITLGFAKLVNKDWQKKVHNSDKDFSVDESCNSCGICEQVCPVDNITIKDGKPHWQHKCQECLACIHYCPKAAIQCGQKKDTKVRYHHPEIKLKDMLEQK